MKTTVLQSKFSPQLPDFRTNGKGSRLEITERKITIHIDFINNGSEKRETFFALSRKCGSEGGYTVNLLHVCSRGLPTNLVPGVLSYPPYSLPLAP